MLLPSGFPISRGTELYLASKQPLITSQMIDQIKGFFGLVMSLLSIAIVVFKWFKAPDDDEEEKAEDGESDDEGSSKKTNKNAGISDHINAISNGLSSLD